VAVHIAKGRTPLYKALGILNLPEIGFFIF